MRPNSEIPYALNHRITSFRKLNRIRMYPSRFHLRWSALANADLSWFCRLAQQERYKQDFASPVNGHVRHWYLACCTYNPNRHATHRHDNPHRSLILYSFHHNHYVQYCHHGIYHLHVRPIRYSHRNGDRNRRFLVNDYCYTNRSRFY